MKLSTAARVTLVSTLFALFAASGAVLFMLRSAELAAIDTLFVAGRAVAHPVPVGNIVPRPEEFAPFAAGLPLLGEQTAVSRVAVLDARGRVQGEIGEPAVGETLAGLRGQNGALTPVRSFRRQAGRTFHDITLPLFGDLVGSNGVASQVLIGYLHIAVDRARLHDSLAPLAARAGGVATFLVLVWALVTWWVAQRATAPLASLARIVEDVTSGRLDQRLRAGGGEEVNRILSLVNIIVAQVNEQKLHVETDNKLLSLQVEQRNRELLRRNEELDQAVQELTQSRNRLHELAFYDPLTELPNRRLFMEELHLLLQMAIRQKQLIALLFIDLDNFKRINDSLGHSAGDELLRGVSARLRTCLRSSDLVGKYTDPDLRIDVSRLGGDEFTIVLNQIPDADEAARVATRILEVLKEPMVIENHEVVVTPSIGIALAPQDADTVDDLLKLADTAMNRAKTTGKNSYTFFDKEMLKAGAGRLKLEAELRKAVERRELVLHYQPQICTHTGQVLGAEALVRWQHPERGMVPPGEFIPLAEEMGLIVDIGAWTLLEACRNLAVLREAGIDPPKLSVNVSSLQFNRAFSNLVKRALARYGIKPGQLELELTEGVIMSNARASIEALHDLKGLGVSLSVDDFGTGYSSLSYLSQFPLDELKIDRSFVIAFASSQRAEHLVRAIIAMGKSLNLRLVAEGVDALDQFRFLREHEVDLIQGYLFSKPVPLEQLARLFKDNPYPEQIRLMNATSRGLREAS